MHLVAQGACVKDMLYAKRNALGKMLIWKIKSVMHWSHSMSTLNYPLTLICMKFYAMLLHEPGLVDP